MYFYEYTAKLPSMNVKTANNYNYSVTCNTWDKSHLSTIMSTILCPLLLMSVKWYQVQFISFYPLVRVIRDHG